MSGPRRLLIDIGHSRIKWVLVPHGAAVPDEPSACAHAQWSASSLAAEGADEAWVAGVVPELSARVGAELQALGLPVSTITTGARPAPVAAAYQSMGVDRWLALQPLWEQHTGPFMLADCGSALTIDLVDAQGIHRGGWIAPGFPAAALGLKMTFTGLPPASAETSAPADQPGLDTGQQIASGLWLQQAAMIERSWRAGCRALNTVIPLTLTGGDAARVQCLLDVPSRRDEALVLKGLSLLAGKN